MIQRREWRDGFVQWCLQLQWQAEAGLRHISIHLPLQQQPVCFLHQTVCNSRLYLISTLYDLIATGGKGRVAAGRLPALINGVGRYLLCNPDCIDLFHCVLLPALFCNMCLLLWHLAAANWHRGRTLLLLLQCELLAVIRWPPSVSRPEHYMEDICSCIPWIM